MIGVRHLVVYGSLRRGEGAAALEGFGRALAYVREVAFPGIMYDLGDYAGVVLAPDAGLVRAELHTILRPSMLTALDAYERFRPFEPQPYDPRTGKGSLFVRQVIEVEGVRAYVYLYNGEKGRPLGPVVASGEWRRSRI